MHPLHRNFRVKKATDEGGFTLIELLVVVVILGTVIAIAIPLYLNYRRDANDAAAQSDLRSVVNVLEQCYADNGSYQSTGSYRYTSSTSQEACQSRMVLLSSGTTMMYLSDSGASYIVAATNSKGSGKVYCYDSGKGGRILPVAGTTLDTVVC